MLSPNGLMNAKPTLGRQTWSLSDALDASPAMRHLSALVNQSNKRLNSISHLLPKHAKGSIQAGPINDEEWSLLVANAALSAKLRQMLPDLEQELLSCGWPARKIRIKIVKH
jgi:hypothetical protein